MIFDKPEQPPVPQPEVEIGKWFRPFEEYSNQPYLHHRQDYSAKSFPFRMTSLGTFSADVERDIDDYESNEPALVITPEGIELTTANRVAELEKKYGTQFTIILVTSKEESFTGHNPPYKVEVRYQDTLLESPFVTGDELIAKTESGLSESLS